MFPLVYGIVKMGVSYPKLFSEEMFDDKDPADVAEEDAELLN